MKILITGAWAQGKSAAEKLNNAGFNAEFLQNEKDEIPCPYEEIEAVICNGLFLYHKIEDFTNLKYIQLISAGYDRVPMDYIKEKGIKIFNAGGVYSIPMAEFAVCGVLQLYKGSRFFYENQKERKWEKSRSLLELSGKTVCIIGCGSVGYECAKRFSAFGCRVYGVDILTAEKEFFNKIDSIEKLNEYLLKADVVVLTLPLTKETEHIINEERFSSFKSGAILVNIARGAVIETTALVEALNEKLGGAVLDVFEEEPLNEVSALWEMENVILTPHNSFVGDGNNERLRKLIFKNLSVEYGDINE